MITNINEGQVFVTVVGKPLGECAACIRVPESESLQFLFQPPTRAHTERRQVIAQVVGFLQSLWET